MKITKQRREEIEKAWVKESEKYYGGEALCWFLKKHYTEAESNWCSTWKKQEFFAIYCYFGAVFDYNTADLTYLCRALSLNMLLDDNTEE